MTTLDVRNDTAVFSPDNEPLRTLKEIRVSELVHTDAMRKIESAGESAGRSSVGSTGHVQPEDVALFRSEVLFGVKLAPSSHAFRRHATPGSRSFLDPVPGHEIHVGNRLYLYRE
eukprot:TRINITY_DN18870_c0_g1::TRINITY_DN18870_c0_g1_i1::g.1430::m.1430 TRINITY_DN18870_c0_g1::TRINITY_DN18870_c0_g1_i1::g.1430  ORF type:complete len:128 (+),score=24.25 TRINITY_DN18870_c0_g1_i1:42-386(+)